jgi:hypothetical protein
MTSWRTGIFAVSIGALAVMAVNGVAVAATGNALILGHHNYANTVTTVQRTTAGVPVSLIAKAGSAPLAVNSSKVVTHLNADYVDGTNAVDLQTRPIRYVIPTLASSTTRSVMVLNGVPHGIYLASFNIIATSSALGTQVNCYLSTDMDAGSNDSQLIAYGSSYSTYSTSNSSGIVDFRTGTGLALTCFSGTNDFNYKNASGFDDVVTLVRVDALTVHTGSVTANIRQAAAGAGSTGR